MSQNPGCVVLVGAGPGDPGLLTLSGARAIAEADAIVYDALAPAATLRHSRPGVELHYAGKRSGSHTLKQDEINALIVALATDGKRVVRLKGGDPFVFGRGSEEALACRAAGIPFSVVPGVSSALAAPAYAGIPITHRNLAGNFLVLAGHEADESASTNWAFAAQADTLVILMGASSLAGNMASLAAAGKPLDTPVACVRWGTRADQQVVTGSIETIAAAVSRTGLGAPVAVVVGPVAALADKLAWFEAGPLAGHRVAVTRARSAPSELARKLEEHGALVIEAPVISIRPPAKTDEMVAALLAGSDWTIFTSHNAVHAVIDCLRDHGSDVRALAGTKLAAIGSATAAALSAMGLRPDFTPSTATAESLASELPISHGESVTLPLSSLASRDLELALTARGAITRRVTAYQNVPEPLTGQQLRDVLESSVVTFTSASTAVNLRAALGDLDLDPGVKLVSIGPRTSESVQRAFGRVDREARTPAIEALVEAVLEVVR
ncbi:MAG: uroporphyrinogen-III C-methyltransferase [Dehalococcoidia bacterium]